MNDLLNQQRLKMLKKRWPKTVQRLEADGDCLLYPTKKGDAPSINLGGNVMALQRAAYLLYHGTVTPDMCVVSTCGKKNCLTEGHLEEISRAEMMRLRGVHEGLNVGADHPSTDLNDEAVLQIRTMVEAGDMPKDVAAEFGTSYHAVMGIVKGRSWKHLGGPLWGKDYTVMGRASTRRVVRAAHVN